MICKYYLMFGNDKIDKNSQSCIDVSSMITNLDDIKLSYTRVDFGGVTRKISSSIEFVKEARIRLIDYYNTNGLSSLVSFFVYCLSDCWEEDEIFACPLDFATFSYDTYVAKIGCLDNSTAALIKANRNTQYEFFVSELQDSSKLEFDRLAIQNEGYIIISGEEPWPGNDSYTWTELPRDAWWFFPNINILDIDAVNNESFILKDCQQTFQTDGTMSTWGIPAINNTDVYFLECIKDCVVSIDFTDAGFSSTYYSSPGFMLSKITGNTIVPLTAGYSNIMSKSENTYSSSIRWTGQLIKGDKLQYAVFNYSRNSIGTSYVFVPGKKGSITWREKAEPAYINIISPSVLLSKLVESMCGESVKGLIKDDDNIENIMLCPAESIRKYPNAKIHTSFDDFCKWMECTFGYVYQLERIIETENSVTLEQDIVVFKHRDKLFDNKQSYVINDASDILYSVASDRIYSVISIGYKKQEYELGNNGKDEFNFGITYTTDVTLDDKTLSLISPYRADSYGMEELLYKTGQDTSTDSSDTQIFAVSCSYMEEEKKYVLNRNVLIGGVMTETVFNALLNPTKMVESNKRYIASFAKLLTFVSTDGNSMVTFNGKSLTDNIILENPLFGRGNIKFTTRKFIPVSLFTGCIEIQFNGQSVKGYITNVNIKISQDESFDYELIECF